MSRLQKPFAELAKVAKKITAAEKSGATKKAAPTQVNAPKHTVKSKTTTLTEDNTPPSARSVGNERIAFLQAYRDVVPLDKTTRVVAAPIVKAAMESSRTSVESLAKLVAGGLRFHVHREADGYIEAFRHGEESALARLLRAKVLPTAQVDLHGVRVEDVEKLLLTFVRRHANGAGAVVLVIHGKGLHSPLRDAPVRGAVHAVLESGAAAALTHAFTTAPAQLGGNGATLVLARSFG